MPSPYKKQYIYSILPRFGLETAEICLKPTETRFTGRWAIASFPVRYSGCYIPKPGSQGVGRRLTFWHRGLGYIGRIASTRASLRAELSRCRHCIGQRAYEHTKQGIAASNIHCRSIISLIPSLSYFRG